MDALILLVLDLAAVSSLLYIFNLIPSKPTKQPMNRSHLFFCKTFHTRFYPVRHTFQYPVLYVGVDLDDLDGARNAARWWFGYNTRWSLMSLRDQDYLGPPIDQGKASIKDKLLAQLETHNIPLSTVAALSHITLVTTPRVFGYAFNPVSFYFCYDDANSLRVVLLEVNNTFGEKHLYALDCDEMKHGEGQDGGEGDVRIRSGYNTSHTLPRTFHVSPFNDRTGAYTIHTRDLLAVPAAPYLDVRIVIHNNPDPNLPADFSVTGSPSKKFMAKVEGAAIPLTARSVAISLTRYVVDVFATMPRIMFEAGVLHYKRGLKVYPRPEPKVEWGTVGVKKPEAFESQAQQIVTAYLAHLIVADGTHALTIHLPDPSLPTINLSCSTSTPTATVIHVHLTNYAFFTNLLFFPNHIQALVNGYGEGVWRCENPAQVVELLRLVLEAGRDSANVYAGGKEGWNEKVIEWYRRRFLAAVMEGAKEDKAWVRERLVEYVAGLEAADGIGAKEVLILGAGQPLTTSPSSPSSYVVLQSLPMTSSALSSTSSAPKSRYTSLLPPLLSLTNDTLPINPIDTFVRDHTLAESFRITSVIRAGVFSVLTERFLFDLAANFVQGRNPFEVEKRVWHGVKKILDTGASDAGSVVAGWVVSEGAGLESKGRCGSEGQELAAIEHEEDEDDDDFQKKYLERVRAVMRCLKTAAVEGRVVDTSKAF